MGPRRRVLVIDDHRLFAEALSVVLRDLGSTEVALATSAEEAIAELARPARPDLILLDLGLPGLRGRTAYHAIAGAAPGVPIVIVTAAEPSAESFELVQEGARGFIHKRANSAELLRALRYVLDGGTFVPPELLRTPAMADGEVRLTPRQRDVLAMLARGLCNKDISSTLGISEATVRVHVSSVLRALGVENRTQAATSPYARRLIGR